jgi:adenylate cyclase
MSDRQMIEPRHGGLSVPHRVLRTVRAEQAASEWMISWIELAVVLTFAGLYAIAPKTAPVEAFNPVPWILLAYLLVVGLRLWLTHRGWLPAWILTLSAIIDMALLMALIWSFHIQYDQPAAFYLKASTWAYVFIFIALRALRFEPRYVLVAGASAMVGWAVLVAYALLSMPGVPVTRDYLAYTSAPLVLLGAEFDKLITIAVVTVILALALDRGRRLVIRAACDAAADRHQRLHLPRREAAAGSGDRAADGLSGPGRADRTPARGQHRQVHWRRGDGDFRCVSSPPHPRC